MQVDVPSLLLYADRRIERLHEELDEQERKVHEKVAAAVQQQKEVDAGTAENRLQAEIERLKSEYAVDLERMVSWSLKFICCSHIKFYCTTMHLTLNTIQSFLCCLSKLS